MCLPQKDGQAELNWVADYRSRWFTCTHPNTNQAEYGVTTLIEINVLPLIKPRSTQCKTYQLIIRSVCSSKKAKVLPTPKGPLGGADLRFNSPQPDTRWSCKSTDTGLVCCVQCLFSSELLPVPIYTAWWQKQQSVRNLLKVFMLWCPGQESNSHLWNASPMP